MSTWKADTDVTSNTLEATEKSSDTPEATEVPSDTPEATEEPSNTPEVTEEPSNTPEATEAPSDTPEATEVPSDTPEATEEPSDTPEATEVPSDTPEITEVPSDTPEATEVPSDTPENTEAPTETTAATVEDTATPTLTETSAAVSTDTPTPTATLTATATLTETVSGTATSTPTLTATETATETATATMTETVAGTPTEAPPAPFESAYYIYDGDDNMVMSVINNVTTYYPSSSYVVEVDGSDTTVRKTYSAGSTSLAVRTIVNSTENTLNWMLSDHLGSSSITTAADGTWNSEIRYSAFGETRYSSGIMPTDYRYTNQLEQKDVNLYYYNARYYDASLGRFIQADTIVPNPASQKSYDRYTYVNNNPIRYTDPSGHCMAVDENGNLTDRCKNRWAAYSAAALKYYYGISYSSADGESPVSLSTRTNIALGAMYSGNKLKTYENKTTWDAFKNYHGNIHIEIGTTKEIEGNCITENGIISCNKDLTIPNTIHEFGHVFDSNFGLRPHDLDGISVKTNTGSEMFDWVGTYADGYWIRSTKGFICDTSLCLEHPPSMDKNQTDGNAKSEQFADFYMNWILDGTNDPYHGFSNDSYGAARRKYFGEQQIPWVLNVQGE